MFESKIMKVGLCLTILNSSFHAVDRAISTAAWERAFNIGGAIALASMIIFIIRARIEWR